MADEQTNEGDTKGTEADKALSPDGEPLTEYEKALALVKRREEATKAENEVLDRKEKLAANTMLGGTGGGRVEPVPKTKEETQAEIADKFSRGELDLLEK